MPDRLPCVSITTEPTSKPWWQSRTFRANGVVALLAIVVLAAEQIKAGLLPVPAEALPWVMFGLAVLNIWLRTITSEPITGTPAAHGD